MAVILVVKIVIYRSSLSRAISEMQPLIGRMSRNFRTPPVFEAPARSDAVRM